MTENDSSTCDLCGKEADPRYDECVVIVCIGRCHAPREHDIYHEKCLKQYMRTARVLKGDKKGFACPKGKGRGTLATYKCAARVLHSQKAKAEVVQKTQPAAVAPQVLNLPDAVKGGRTAAGARKPPIAPKATKAAKKPTLCMPRNTYTYNGSTTAAGPSQPFQQLHKTPNTAAEAEGGPPQDLLGRNLIAAAAANAKAAKKNAKRVAARLRRQQDADPTAVTTMAAAAAAAAADDDATGFNGNQYAGGWLGGGAESDSDDDTDCPWVQGGGLLQAWTTAAAAGAAEEQEEGLGFLTIKAAAATAAGEFSFEHKSQSEGDSSLDGFASAAAKRFEEASAANAAKNAALLKVFNSLEIPADCDITEDDIISNMANSTAPMQAASSSTLDDVVAPALTVGQNDTRPFGSIVIDHLSPAETVDNMQHVALHQSYDCNQPAAAGLGYQCQNQVLTEVQQQSIYLHDFSLAPAAAAEAAAAASSRAGVWMHSGDQLQRVSDPAAAAAAAAGHRYQDGRSAAAGGRSQFASALAFRMSQSSSLNAVPVGPSAPLAAVHTAAPENSSRSAQQHHQPSMLSSVTAAFLPAAVMATPQLRNPAMAPLPQATGWAPPSPPQQAAAAVAMAPGTAAMAPTPPAAVTPSLPAMVPPPPPTAATAMPTVMWAPPPPLPPPTTTAAIASSAAGAATAKVAAGVPPLPLAQLAAPSADKSNFTLSKELLAAARIPVNFRLTPPMPPSAAVAAATQHPPTPNVTPRVHGPHVTAAVAAAPQSTPTLTPKVHGAHMSAAAAASQCTPSQTPRAYAPHVTAAVAAAPQSTPAPTPRVPGAHMPATAAAAAQFTSIITPRVRCPDMTTAATAAAAEPAAAHGSNRSSGASIGPPLNLAERARDLSVQQVAPSNVKIDHPAGSLKGMLAQFTAAAAQCKMSGTQLQPELHTTTTTPRPGDAGPVLNDGDSPTYSSEDSRSAKEADAAAAGASDKLAEPGVWIPSWKKKLMKQDQLQSMTEDVGSMRASKGDGAASRRRRKGGAVYEEQVEEFFAVEKKEDGNASDDELFALLCT